jgi:hypothetical protein
MEGLTQLGSERLFSNDRTQQSFVATRSADYTTSRAKNVLGKSCDQDTGFSEIVAARPQTALVACINLTESLIRQIHAQPVALLHEYLWRASKPVSSFFSQEPDLAAFLRPRRSTSAKR